MNFQTGLYAEFRDDGAGFDEPGYKTGTFPLTGTGLFDTRDKLDHPFAPLKIDSTSREGAIICVGVVLDMKEHRR